MIYRFIIIILLLIPLTGCHLVPTGYADQDTMIEKESLPGITVAYDLQIDHEYHAAIKTMIFNSKAATSTQKQYTAASGKECLWLDMKAKSWVACQAEGDKVWHVMPALVDADSILGLAGGRRETP